MFLEGLNRLIGIFIAAIKNIWRVSIWGPFLTLFGLQFILLICLANYANPSLYPILSPLVAILGERQADIMAHYPGLYLLLPGVFQYGKIAIGILFEGLIGGITVVAFLKIFARSQYAELNIKTAFRQWPNLLLCWSVIFAVIYLLNTQIPPLFEDQLYGSPRRQIVFDLGMGFITTVIYSLVIYSIPIIIMSGRSFLSAIGQSLYLFRRHPFFTFFLALIAYLVTLPTSFLAGRADTIVEKFSPEMVYYILLAGIIIDLLLNIVLTGALTKFLTDESR